MKLPHHKRRAQAPTRRPPLSETASWLVCIGVFAWPASLEIFFPDLKIGMPLLAIYGLAALVFGIRSAESFRAAILCFGIIIAATASGQSELGESFAVYAFLLLVIGTVCAVKEEWLASRRKKPALATAHPPQAAQRAEVAETRASATAHTPHPAVQQPRPQLAEAAERPLPAHAPRRPGWRHAHQQAAPPLAKRPLNAQAATRPVRYIDQPRRPGTAAPSAVKPPHPQNRQANGLQSAKNHATIGNKSGKRPVLRRGIQ